MQKTHSFRLSSGRMEEASAASLDVASLALRITEAERDLEVRRKGRIEAEAESTRLNLLALELLDRPTPEAEAAHHARVMERLRSEESLERQRERAAEAERQVQRADEALVARSAEGITTCCLVCCSRPASYAVWPCGHLALCRTCTTQDYCCEPPAPSPRRRLAVRGRLRPNDLALPGVGRGRRRLAPYNYTDHVHFDYDAAVEALWEDEEDATAAAVETIRNARFADSGAEMEEADLSSGTAEPGLVTLFAAMGTWSDLVAFCHFMDNKWHVDITRDVEYIERQDSRMVLHMSIDDICLYRPGGADTPWRVEDEDACNRQEVPSYQEDMCEEIPRNVLNRLISLWDEYQQHHCIRLEAPSSSSGADIAATDRMPVPEPHDGDSAAVATSVLTWPPVAVPREQCRGSCPICGEQVEGLLRIFVP